MHGSWVKFPFYHPESWAQAGLSQAPGNAEELWVCCAPLTQLRLEEKLSRWRLIIPLPFVCS